MMGRNPVKLPSQESWFPIGTCARRQMAGAAHWRGSGMPLQPSKHLQFDSYNRLLQWLPEATESQLMTVFVWANNPQAPPGDARRLAQVRTEAFEVLVARAHDRLVRFLMQRGGCSDPDLA